METILDILGLRDYDVGITFESNLAIRKRNKRYRNVDSATDILSFPLYDHEIAGKISQVCTSKLHS